MSVWVSPRGSNWFSVAAVPPYRSHGLRRIVEDGPRSDGEAAILNALADKLEALRAAE